MDVERELAIFHIAEAVQTTLMDASRSIAVARTEQANVLEVLCVELS